MAWHGWCAGGGAQASLDKFKDEGEFEEDLDISGQPLTPRRREALPDDRCATPPGALSVWLVWLCGCGCVVGCGWLWLVVVVG
jgi:hypothetical protein